MQETLGVSQDKQRTEMLDRGRNDNNRKTETASTCPGGAIRFREVKETLL